MRAINQKATKVMDVLTKDLTADNTYRKIDNSSGIMPVSVEWIGNNLFSVAHYYEQNGDLMADPEMTFWKDSDNKYYPCSFKQDCFGIYRESVRFDNEVPSDIMTSEQKNEAVFAGQWMENIKFQQNL